MLEKTQIAVDIVVVLTLIWHSILITRTRGILMLMSKLQDLDSRSWEEQLVVNKNMRHYIRDVKADVATLADRVGAKGI